MKIGLKKIQAAAYDGASTVFKISWFNTIYFMFRINLLNQSVYVQDISHWNVSFELTLTDQNMQVRFC